MGGASERGSGHSEGFRSGTRGWSGASIPSAGQTSGQSVQHNSRATRAGQAEKRSATASSLWHADVDPLHELGGIAARVTPPARRDAQDPMRGDCESSRVPGRGRSTSWRSLAATAVKAGCGRTWFWFAGEFPFAGPHLRGDGGRTGSVVRGELGRGHRAGLGSHLRHNPISAQLSPLRLPRPGAARRTRTPSTNGRLLAGRRSCCHRVEIAG